MKKLQNFLPLETAILKSHLSRFQRLLIQSLKSGSDPLAQEEAFLFSTVDLARALHCSLSTANRLIKSGIIKKHRHGPHIFYVVSEVLEAIASNERVASYLSREPKPKRTVAPKIYYKCLLVPGNVLFVEVRHQGWNASIVCHPELWGDTAAIENLVHAVVDIRHSIRPFKIRTSRPDELKVNNCFNLFSKN